MSTKRVEMNRHTNEKCQQSWIHVNKRTGCCHRVKGWRYVARIELPLIPWSSVNIWYTQFLRTKSKVLRNLCVAFLRKFVWNKQVIGIHISIDNWTVYNVQDKEHQSHEEVATDDVFDEEYGDYPGQIDSKLIIAFRYWKLNYKHSVNWFWLLRNYPKLSDLFICKQFPTHLCCW